MDDRILYSLLGCSIPPPCPLGPPPDGTNLLDDIEHLIEEIEIEPKLSQESRQIDLDGLLTDYRPTGPSRKLRPKRDFTTGKILEFEEVEKGSDGPLSLCRPFDKKNGNAVKSVVGNAAIGIPFWPGGFDPIDELKNLTESTSTNQSSIDWSNLKRDPPKMHGMNFDKKSDNFKIEDLIKDELEQSSSWRPIFKVADSSKNLDLENKKSPKNQETESEAFEELKLDDQKALESPSPSLVRPADKTRINEVFMVNADETMDVSRPWSELVPDPAYQWPFELDHFQKRAVLCLEKHESVFVAAHTSAGKTVVAEYAIALALKHMTKVIYTSPIKALSNQKFRDFRTTFGDVGLLTGDCQIKPEAGCLIMTTEILRSMLYAGSDVIRDLEWVIFDEVHYINDPERGVVWEEVLIMLPSHVGLILLSATVPNIQQFASWVGRIKKRKIFVTSTLKRPVPLEHYMFTGVSTKTSNQLFKIIDPNKRFLNDGYKKASEAKRLNNEKSKKPTADQALWSSIIDCLKKRNGLPAVAFIFSRKRCDSYPASLKGCDLTTPQEKNEILLFYHRCISRLKPIDRKLPQVTNLQELLSRGLGVHHSGILPILKETIELLFARGLVKILFATETFAMGVNMPARSVVFDSIRKYDSSGMRELIPSEYIQMAGRAGRRGLDATGTVILLQKGPKVVEQQVLHNMMLGKAAPLVSKFRLTYGMLLSILRVEYLRVEDMMLRSFVEFGKRGQATQENDLERHQAKIEDLEYLEDKLDGTDFKMFVEYVNNIIQIRKQLIHEVKESGSSKLLHPGRIIQIKKSSPAIILKLNYEKVTVLHNVNKDEKSPLLKSVLNGQLSHPDSVLPKIEEINFETISMIFKDTIRLSMSDVNNEIQKGFSGSYLNRIARDLIKMTSFRPIHFIQDGALKNIEHIEIISRLDNLMEQLDAFQTPNLTNYETDIDNVNELLKLKEELKAKEYNISEDSLLHLPEYHARLKLLKHWNYVRDDGDVQLKGRVACQYRGGNELLLTEMLLSNGLKPLSPSEVCALFSSLVFQSKIDDENELISQLPETCQIAINSLKEIREDVLAKEAEFGIISTDHDSGAPLCFGLSLVVYKWAQGEPFKDIMSCTQVQEGVIVRCIQRLEELCREVRNGARTIGDFNTTSKMEQCSEAIKRDIVFAASLYTQD